MSKPSQSPEYRKLARKLASDSIVTTALARLLEQVIETAAEHARDSERERCVRLAEGQAAYYRGKTDAFSKASVLMADVIADRLKTP